MFNPNNYSSKVIITIADIFMGSLYSSHNGNTVAAVASQSSRSPPVNSVYSRLLQGFLYENFVRTNNGNMGHQV